MMNNAELAEWLMENAGPVIKYRALKELACFPDKDLLEKRRAELLKHPQVQARLGYLQHESGSIHGRERYIHGRVNRCLENCIPMLTDFGLEKGFAEFDSQIYPLMRYLKENPWSVAPVFCEFGRVITYPFFLRAGYHDDDLLCFMYERLNTLHSFTSAKDYDIYDLETTYKGVPKSFQNRPIIKPRLYTEGKFKIPLIYDIYGLAALIGFCDEAAKQKINTVIEYIMSPEYNRFITFYGILSSGKGRYHAMGWDCKLPFYFDEMDINKPELYLHRFELMAHFPNAVGNSWFERALKHFEGYRTTGGTYAFPKEYLLERESVWVLGTHMSLGESRKGREFIELESTFRMLKLKKVAGLF